MNSLISLFFCLSLFLSFGFAIAQEEPSEKVPERNAVVPADKEVSSQTLRSTSNYSINLHASILSTWLPMKFGAAIGYIQNENWTYEAEFTRRSISAKIMDVDLGQVIDQRYGVQARWYPGSNSFNLIMGLFKSSFSLELGPSYLANIPGAPATTLWKFESIGPQIGLSNRWQWASGIAFGVDWFVIYVPAFNKTADEDVFNYITNQKDRDDLDKVTKAIKNIPQFDLLKVTLGYSF